MLLNGYSIIYTYSHKNSILHEFKDFSAHILKYVFEKPKISEADQLFYFLKLAKTKRMKNRQKFWNVSEIIRTRSADSEN